MDLYGPQSADEAQAAMDVLQKMESRHKAACDTCKAGEPCQMAEGYVRSIGAASVLLETARVVD